MQYRYLLPQLLLVLFLQTASYGQGNQSVNLPKKTDSLVQAFLSKYSAVPGIAVAVVNAKGPILVKGYGYANKEKGIKADENTLYYIASSTKSFTALAAALLDREKKILLDSPFKRYIPQVAFKNRINDSITVRHLLTHTSGLTNSALIYRYAFTGNIDRSDLLKVLSDLTENSERPGNYRYTNLGYNIYGMLLKESLNLQWQDLLQNKIFTPLKMNSTTAYISAAKNKTSNIAVPYTAFGRTGFERIELEKIDNTMQSAGGLVTSVSDLSKWLMVQINKGKAGNQQVFPAEVILATQNGFATKAQGSFPFTGDGQYGLGWQINEYKGQKVIHHFGGYPGFRSHVSFMPDKKVGLAILVNEGMAGAAFADALSVYIYDVLLGNEGAEEKYASMITDFEKRYAQIKERMEKNYQELSQRTCQLSLPLISYTGKYYNPYLGTMEVSIVNDTLAVKHGHLKSTSNPFSEKDAIRVEMMPLEGSVVAFKVEGDKVTALKYGNREYIRQ